MIIHGCMDAIGSSSKSKVNGYNYNGMSVNAVSNNIFISASSCNHSSFIGGLKILNMTLDVARCLGCCTWMHQEKHRDDQDDPRWSWMSWMSIYAQVVP